MSPKGLFAWLLYEAISQSQAIYQFPEIQSSHRKFGSWTLSQPFGMNRIFQCKSVDTLLSFISGWRPLVNSAISISGSGFHFQFNTLWGEKKKLAHFQAELWCFLQVKFPIHIATIFLGTVPTIAISFPDHQGAFCFKLSVESCSDVITVQQWCFPG